MQQMTPMTLALLFYLSSASIIPQKIDVNYDKRVSPHTFTGKAVNITLLIQSLHIINVDESSEVISWRLAAQMNWYDERLRFNAKTFNGHSEFFLPADLVWIPRITVGNSIMFRRVEGIHDLEDVRVEADGRVSLFLSAHLQTLCTLQFRQAATHTSSDPVSSHWFYQGQGSAYPAVRFFGENRFPRTLVSFLDVIEPETHVLEWNFPFDWQMCDLLIQSPLHPMTHQDITLIVKQDFTPTIAGEEFNGTLFSLEEGVELRDGESYKMISLRIALRRIYLSHFMTVLVPSSSMVSFVLYYYYISCLSEKEEGHDEMDNDPNITPYFMVFFYILFLINFYAPRHSAAGEKYKLDGEGYSFQGWNCRECSNNIRVHSIKKITVL